jgi:signal transduction histidine kinase
MATNDLARGSIPFQAEGRLLQELGLRLVAKPEVALVELIKNAYDADAPSCTVRFENREQTLVVTDDGHGMSITDFKTKWMRIATANKLAKETSAKFGRRLTGSKGIGRFAVRYLGDHLTLESVAFDSEHKCMAKLKAVFDWPKIDETGDLSKTAVEYSLVRVPNDTATGTTLTIRSLRSATDFTRSTDLRDEVLKIVSPLQGLESGRFANTNVSEGKDPGFRVILPGETNADDLDLAKLILGNYWGRLTVELNRKSLKFRVWLPGVETPKKLDVSVNTHISKGFFADIRFFPRRKGVFQDKGVRGQKAWNWVRNNCGVKVVDHGFHILPYGFPNDDWLSLDRDKAHSERDWKTEIAKNKFPVTAIEKNDPAANPVLYLPYNLQLVGAVFIETRRNLGGKDETDLVPSMDREGLLENAAFEELCEYVRAGVEFLAREDKAEIDRRLEREAKEAARTAREDIQQAIRHIETSPTLTPGDKSRIVKQYRYLADRLEEQEEYSAQARRSLTTMSLLGVVAGFMTHESKAIVDELEQVSRQLHALSKKHPDLESEAEKLDQRLENFQGYLSYARMFVKNVRAPKEQPFSAAGQVRYIIKQFDKFREERRIQVINEIASDVMTPAIPVTIYSGVLLNLYTNALKAVTAAQTSIREPRITFRAWNEKKKHVIEIADNGIGIPPELRKRIWEPLYTTTSDIGNPLGSGMGLGLTLVKQVVSEIGGSISLVPDPPPGFTTCFRVQFPKT